MNLISMKFKKEHGKISDKARQVLRDINKRSGNKDGKHPTYKDIHCEINTNDEIEEFVYWYVREYFKQKLKDPDVKLILDRINNLGSYSMQNIQVISHIENEIKKAGDHAIQYCGRLPTKQEKYCHSCHYIKPRDTIHFYKDKHERDGLRGNCKECTK